MIPPPTTATVGAFILTRRVSRFLLLNISSTNGSPVSRELVIVCPVTSHWFYWIISGQNFYFI